MHRGYVKLWRKIEDSAIWGNPEMMAVWLWCLVKATHKKRYCIINTGKGKATVEIQPGQFVFGRHVAAKELKMRPSSIRDRMQRLQDLDMISLKPDTHRTIVTICNWDVYNGDEKAIRHATDTLPTRYRHATDTDKNDKHIRKKDIHAPSFDFEVFWSTFPAGRKKSKAAARASWEKAIKIANPEFLIKRASDYAASDEGRGAFVKMPSTWLNQQCWDDCPAAWKNKTDQPKERPYDD